MGNRFLLWAATLVSLSFGLAATSYADIWVADPTTDCTIWSGDDGSAKEVPAWSGACVDGKASGFGSLVVSDKDGLLVVFTGEMKQGKADGSGTLKVRNEDTGKFDHYLGNFSAGTPKGNGIFDSSEGWRLQGYFDGTFDTGNGTLYLDVDDAVIRGEFKGGDLVGDAFIYYETKEGEMYFGDIAGGKREGFGTLVHANDDSYVGEFEKGVASGTGVYESADGSLMIGRYAEGAPNGPGSYIAPNGDVYQGIFKNGKGEGKILVTKADGSQTIETWVNGEKQ